MRMFMSKNHVYKNFDVIGIQIRFVALFSNKILLRNHPAFNSKGKFEGLIAFILIPEQGQSNTPLGSDKVAVFVL